MCMHGCIMLLVLKVDDCNKEPGDGASNSIPLVGVSGSPVLSSRNQKVSPFCPRNGRLLNLEGLHKHHQKVDAM